jgi:hypothetical protein
MPNTVVLEALNHAAKRLARERAISFAQAFEIVLSMNPRAYDQYLEERSNAGAPGGRGAARYTEQVRDLVR